jgi:hypothetical protein
MCVRKWLVTWAAAGAALAPAAGADGKEAFVDYYTTASTLIHALNGIAADLDRMDLLTGDYPAETAQEVKARLIKVREGFASVLTYDDHTDEINEGYLLYIDEVLLAVLTAQEYREKGGTERRESLAQLLQESSKLRAELNQKIQRDKKAYGLD